MPVLPDISVLLPLIYSSHRHHPVALAWMNTVRQDDTVVLCRITQLGLMRLLNNPVVMGDDVQSGAETWQTWDTLVDDQRFRFAAEPKGFDVQLRTLSAPFAVQPKRWQDACLAAFAMAADLELVTFDTGFRSFPGLRRRILTPEIPQ